MFNIDPLCLHFRFRYKSILFQSIIHSRTHIPYRMSRYDMGFGNEVISYIDLLHIIPLYLAEEGFQNQRKSGTWHKFPILLLKIHISFDLLGKWFRHLIFFIQLLANREKVCIHRFFFLLAGCNRLGERAPKGIFSNSTWKQGEYYKLIFLTYFQALLWKCSSSVLRHPT